MAEIVYAVHTRACTYLLDDEGFCRWVLSRSGAKSDDRCVGAQFVAALDLHSKGGLIGELRIGASALFIRSENGRFVLIRTKPIEHVEIRGGEDDEGFPEEEPVVLPDRLAVAAVFDAPVAAREPEPPSARVILQTQPRTEPPPPMREIASPTTEPLPRSVPPLPPAPPPVRFSGPDGAASGPIPRAPVERSFPKPPPREPARPAFPEPPPREPARPAFPEPPPRVPTQVMRSFPEPPPRVPSEPPRASFPEPPSRVSSEPPRPFPEPRGAPRRGARDASSETQPLPPSGPVPAWPPMLAPPPPQAEMLPLGPARPHLPSAEELDAGDLEEVMEDDQIYSMEVTLTMPLFKGDPAAAHHFRR